MENQRKPQVTPNRVDRRIFLGTFASGAVAPGRFARPNGQVAEKAEATPDFALEEVTVQELVKRMESGQDSSRSITGLYLRRIRDLNPKLSALIEINPDALADAEARDRERKQQDFRPGPLHGVPVVLKDNIDTHDKMTTTAGSLALAGSIAAEDAFIVRRLRQAGAVLLGKANLSEWANFRSDYSSSGWSGRGGQCRNPYVLDRNPCGSSSGSAVAVSANLCPVAVGTETNGSIVCPANANGIVGIKPTLGLISRTGIIPIAHSQDTAGPMARTVADAALLLGVLAGADPADPETAASAGNSRSDYTPFLDATGLKGARIGVARGFFGFHPVVDALLEEAVAEMKRQGAILVDPVELPAQGEIGASSFEVLLYEFKADLNAYLARLGAGAPVKSLAEVIEFNEKHRDKEMPFFGQDLFVKSQAKGPLSSPEYREALQKCRSLAREKGIDDVMGTNRLDAIMAPTGGPAWLTDHVNGDHFLGGSSTPAAVAGYPSISVPMGFVKGLPVNVSFFGRAWSEPVLIRIAYAYEQATKARRVPQLLESIKA